MYKKVIVLSVFYLIISLFYLGCSTNYESKIIPALSNQIFLDDYFILDTKTSISYPNEFKNSVNFLKSFLDQGKHKYLSIENNNHAFNFLRGNERYKYELGGEDIKLHEIKLLVN